MYSRGLTPQRIAALCDAPLVRVNRALNWSRRQTSTLAADHAQHVPPSLPERRHPLTDVWNARYSDLRKFRESAGRMPYSKTTDPIEASIGRWLARQRHAMSQGKLDPMRQRRLDDLGDWRLPARTYRDAKSWSQSLDDLAAFRALLDRLPSNTRTKLNADLARGFMYSDRTPATVG